MEDLIGSRTRALIATHLYGNPVDMDAVAKICAKHDLPIIEDCAQAVGATFKGRPVGTFGYGAFFTFGPTKNCTLLGGGAVATSDPDLGSRLGALAQAHPRTGFVPTMILGAKAAVMSVATHPLPFSLAVLPILRWLDRRGIDLVHRVMGEAPGSLERIEKAPLPSRFMAAVGNAQLARIRALNRGRARNGWYLRSQIVDVPGITLPPMETGSVFVSFPIFHRRRLEIAQKLRSQGVDTDLGFMRNCSSLKFFAGSATDCPHAARAEQEILHLPVFPSLRKKDLDRVAQTLRSTQQGLEA
jgi:dTDP-4-amino-4,6-dideoxygalactose transaminase